MNSTDYIIHAKPRGFDASVIRTGCAETARRLIKTLKRAGWKVEGVVFRRVTESFTELRPVNLTEKTRKN